MNLISCVSVTVVAIMSSNIESIFGSSCPPASPFPACKGAAGANPTVGLPMPGGTTSNFDCANAQIPCCAKNNPTTSQVRPQDCSSVGPVVPSFQCLNQAKLSPACQSGQNITTPSSVVNGVGFGCLGKNVASCCSTPQLQDCEAATAVSLLKCPTADKKFGGFQSKNASPSPVAAPSSGDGTSGFSCPSAATPVCCTQTVPAQGLKDSTGCSAIINKGPTKKQ